MTDTLDKIIVVNSDGSVTIPKEFLGEVGPETGFRLERDGDGFRLELVPLKLHEIGNPEARARAVDNFLRRIARPTGVSWPENYNVRDDIYD